MPDTNLVTPVKVETSSIRRTKTSTPTSARQTDERNSFELQASSAANTSLTPVESRCQSVCLDTTEAGAMPDQTARSKKGQLFPFLVVVGTGAIIGLIASSFSYLSYYEMGFMKVVTTGKVNTGKVYTAGRYVTGPAKTFKKFRSDLHLELFKNLGFFNKEKLEVVMNCSLQYRLIPEELHHLHQAYDIHYKSIFRKSILASLKNAAPKFTVDEYRIERPKVAAYLANAVNITLGGTCCRHCGDRENCSIAERGLFANLFYFQLQSVSITKEQKQRYLLQVIEQEKKDTEKFKQIEKVTRKETERLKRAIDNEAIEVRQNATAKSSLIISKATAESMAIQENARNRGLQIIFDLLNITKPEHKKSFDYLRTLRDHSRANVYIGFNTMIGKP